VYLKNKKQQLCSWKEKESSKIIELISFRDLRFKADIVRSEYILRKIIFKPKLTGVE